MIRIGFLASYRGTNMQAVIDACRDGRIRAIPAVLISSNPDSGALRRARREGVPACHLSERTHPDPEELDRAMVETLQKHGVNLVILCGYMKKVGPQTLNAWRGRMINIHPSLLPRHGGRGMYGLRVHQSVLASGDTETGATVHLVDEEYDHGRTLAQQTVPVLPNDTPETLAERTLQVEHALLVDTVRRIVEGDIPLLKKDEKT